MASASDQGGELLGYSVPVHRALTEPILLGGTPRAIAIMNGTLAGAVGLGLRLWLVGIAIWAIGHLAAAWAAKRDPLFVELFVVHRRIGQFARQRFTVGDAAPHELRPGRDRDLRVNCFGQQTPKLGMVPAKVMAGIVAVRANAGPQFPYLRDQGVAIHLFEIIIHSILQSAWRRGVQP